MAEKTIELSFDGYYSENESEFHLINTTKHHCSGVYAVFVAKQTESGKYNIWEPIYIGKADDVYERLIKDHHHYEDWINELKYGDKLYFTIADVKSDDIDRVEAALIHRIKPKFNIQSTVSFDHDKTTIKSSGIKGAIPAEFTKCHS